MMETHTHNSLVASIASGGTITTSVVESACERLVRRAFAPHEFSSLIEAVFSSENEGSMVRRLYGDDAQTFIDTIDEALDRLDLSPQTRKKCLKSLYKMCGHHALLPRALAVPICYDRMGVALYRGGFADVWKGEHRGRAVAVKVLRTYSDSDLQKIIGRFCKEVVMWKTLQHPNVLPLIGVIMTKTQFAMISEWMVNGNINDFVKAHPGVDRLGLLKGVTRGLIYIHSQGMIHGDLKGANILIDRTGRARLADFGLLTIISDPTNLLSSSSYTQAGTARWMSPELIDPQRFGFEDSRRTKYSDCYALGMVIYETISGHLPFHQHSDLTVFIKVLAGERPHRGVGFTESLWTMLGLCWTFQPKNRPSIEHVLRCLEGTLNLSNPPPRVDETHSAGLNVPASAIEVMPALASDSRTGVRVLTKKARKLERGARKKKAVDGQHPNFIDGVWHCSNCGCPENIAIGRRGGPLGDKSQCSTCGNYWQRHKRPRPVEYSTDPEFHLTPITTANIAKLEAQTASVLPRPLDDDRPWSFVSTASSPSESSIVGLVGVDGGSDCYPPGTLSASNSVGAAPPIAPEWIKRAMEDLRAKYPGGEFDAISRKTKPEKPDDWRIRCHDCPTMDYIVGPDFTLSNFEMHLRNRKHGEKVKARLSQ